MPTKVVEVYEKVFIIIFLFILVSCAYVDATTQPALGDNWDYHIPIAQNIVKGTIFHPQNYSDKWYYPGSSEAILAFLQIVHIPYNFFNFIGLIILFFLLRKLGILFGLERRIATIYAIAVCSLPTIYYRLLSSQSIDLWLLIYIVGIVILCKNPKNTTNYYGMLGFLFGMLIGTKYSGIIYALALIFIYRKSIFSYLTLKRLLAFCSLIFLVGGVWYVRNYIYTGNPFFPEVSFIFSHGKHTVNNVLIYQTWRVLLFVPNGAKMLADAILSEAKMWAFVLAAIPFLFFISKKSKKAVRELLVLGLVGIAVFLISPSWYRYDPLVSSFRYSYTFFTFLILSIFVFVSEIKKISYLIPLAFVNILLFPPISYHAKTLFLFLPIVFIYELCTNSKIVQRYTFIKKGQDFFKKYAN